MLQHLADGLLTGAIIALGAIGLSLTMRILRFANFSHSELLTWGAYCAFLFLGFFAAMDGALRAPIGPFSFSTALLLATVMVMVSLSAVPAGATPRLPLERRVST